MPRKNTKNIAASDYDGTLYQNGAVSPEDLAAIRDWRAGGRRFGLVTGRDLSMIRHEIERWRIPFDFLVCCNGAMLYGADLSELQRRDLPQALIRPLLSHPLARDSLHYEFSASGRTFLCLRSPDSRFPKLGVPYVAISEEEARAMREAQLVSLAFTNAITARRRASVVREAFGGRLRAHRNGPNVDITTQGIDKARGLLDLLRIQDWSETGLLVIGDAENDLPMIRRFRGFSVCSGRESVQGEASAIYASVGKMLRVYLDE